MLKNAIISDDANQGEEGDIQTEILENKNNNKENNNSPTNNGQENDEVNNKNKEKSEKPGILISNSKMAIIRNLLISIKESNDKIIGLLSAAITPDEEARISLAQISDEEFSVKEANLMEKEGEGRIVEGVFDGENMIGPDGKQYSVPANYASKSKLVEGDILKLTITPTGTFVFKQIGPIERTRLVAKLEQDNSGNFTAISDSKKWRLLTASVTYYKGNDGDEVVILVPKTGESKWAAVENIVKAKN